MTISLFSLGPSNSQKKTFCHVESPGLPSITGIVSDGPTHIDEIVNKAYVGREALFNVLFEMQNKKEIISLPGNYYAKII